VTQARVLFFGLAVIYLAGVVVQFFLAGLGTFGATDFDAHQAFGLVLALLTLILLVLAVVGKVPRILIGLAVILLGLNVLQMFLAQVDVEEVAALHVVNALAIVFVAYEIVQRSRRYLASKMAV
jgi:Family of unknown function (DUF6220)